MSRAGPDLIIATLAPIQFLARTPIQARQGICEAWPLSSASEHNGWKAVKLSIDEVGALRKRPRNARAEALAAAVGQTNVAIHGDAYVGRIAYVGKYNVDQKNVSFAVDELAHTAEWAVRALATHDARGDLALQEQANGAPKQVVLASGGDGDGGRYSWNQTEEDVEVTVLKGIPQGPTAKKRIRVSYGGGEALLVEVDREEVFRVEKLFDRVQPDSCSWCLDGESLVITLEKLHARPWVELALPGLTLAP